MKEQIYFVRGMHCASCEILIEKRILEIIGVKSVEASTAKGQVIIEFEGEKPEENELTRIFEKEGYVFSQSKKEKVKVRFSFKDFILSFGLGLLIIAGFLAFSRSGLTELVNVTSASSLPVFFFFGLVAGVSSCAALVGGLILSMSKQWNNLYMNENSIQKKMQPHLMFNLGRLVFYVFFGAVLGLLGSKLQISLEFTSFLVIAISFLMVVLGLQMLGVKQLQGFQIAMPKIITRKVANENNFKGRFMPFLMGASTFFLPCGFTITAQGLALISGGAIQGSLIMLSFVLGTMPMLLFIGFSSIKFSEKPHLSNKFLRVAGVLVLFFAFFNINSQMNVLGLPSFGNGASNPVQVEDGNNRSEDSFPPIVDGKQLIKMQASSKGYSPNYFKVKAGIPVRWEIQDIGTSGCTNAVISRSLFEGEIPLTPGKTSIKEFTPQKAGKYKFSCWMGMISGTIEVVDTNNANGETQVLGDALSNTDDSDPAISSGCGCGGQKSNISNSGSCH